MMIVRTITVGTVISASVFKIDKIFLGCFDKKICFQIMKIITFRGDLTDILAIKEALLLVLR